MSPHFYRSSSLPGTRKLIARLNLAPLDSRLACLRLVVDANALLSAIECIVRSGGSNEPSVRELLRAGAATLYAPPHVATEVHRNLDDLAARLRVSRADVDEVWHSVRKLITFVPVPRSASRHESLRVLRVRDASDVPTAALALRLRADALVTDDPDFSDVPGLLCVSVPDLLRMRAVARVEAEQTGMRLGLTVVGSLAIGGVIAAWRVSPWIVGIGLAVLAAFFLWTQAREGLAAVISGFANRHVALGRQRDGALTSMPASLAAALLPGDVA